MNRVDESTVLIITANSGYKIADIVIDKTVNLSEGRTHKFVNATGNHTISEIPEKLE